MLVSLLDCDMISGQVVKYFLLVINKLFVLRVVLVVMFCRFFDFFDYLIDKEICLSLSLNLILLEVFVVILDYDICYYVVLQWVINFKEVLQQFWDEKMYIVVIVGGVLEDYSKVYLF